MAINRKCFAGAVLACYIDVALCGLSGPGAASQQLNMMPNWTIGHSHTVGVAPDGSYFLEMVLLAKETRNVCYAEWESLPGAYMCPFNQAQPTTHMEATTRAQSR